ncbi:MAG TPA: hypothetical protein VMF03_10095 [Steroidobacteraceae bacterium]|nr:hypothetical protein [Steroidobacteraceae bacterium]
MRCQFGRLRFYGAAAAMIIACNATAETTDASDPVARLGRSFVSLALQLGQVPGHEVEVDSYFGPPALAPAPTAPPQTLAQLSEAAHVLQADIGREQQAAASERGERLLGQASSLASLIDGLLQPHLSFAREASAVYAMSVPAVDPRTTRRTLRALDALLPGTGAIAERLATFQVRFVIAPERRRAVFERALQGCRERTLRHWDLPAGERLDVEWTDSVPAAWQRYRGGGRSTLQINTQAVALVGQALDVACHEAYPGHHAQFLMLEQKAGSRGLAVEDTIALLHSPASVLREGAANFGIDLAFPLAERVAFDRQVLFPLAGIDPALAQRYEQVNALVADLSVAAVPILAAYRDGRLPSAVAAAELEDSALIGSPQALLRFLDDEGAYTLGYTAARDRVRRYVERHSACTGQDPWRVLADVVSTPQVAVLDQEAAQCAAHPDGTG